MRPRHALLLACLLLLPTAASAITVLNATLTGLAEVPPNASTATGTATVTLDTGGTTISWTVTYSGLLGTLTASHIHTAPIGTNGPVTIALNPVAGTTSGTYSGSAAVTPAQASDLLAGLDYVNIHSNLFPGGEIRGQLTTGVTPAARGTWGRIKLLYR